VDAAGGGVEGVENRSNRLLLHLPRRRTLGMMLSERNTTLIEIQGFTKVEKSGEVHGHDLAAGSMRLTHELAGDLSGTGVHFSCTPISLIFVQVLHLCILPPSCRPAEEICS
jgi:hypothetical protein